MRQKITPEQKLDVGKSYLNGESMEDIAKRLNLTRARIHQIISYELKIPLHKRARNEYVCSDCNSTFHIPAKNGRQGWVSKKKGIARCGQCVEKIGYDRRSGYWSAKHKLKGCIECGRSDRRHQSRGRCCACASKDLYHTDPNRKEQVRRMTDNWVQRNREHVKKRMAEYQKEYVKRPEVQERIKAREEAIKNDPALYEARKVKMREYAKKAYARRKAKVAQLEESAKVLKSMGMSSGENITYIQKKQALKEEYEKVLREEYEDWVTRRNSMIDEYYKSVQKSLGEERVKEEAKKEEAERERKYWLAHGKDQSVEEWTRTYTDKGKKSLFSKFFGMFKKS